MPLFQFLDEVASQFRLSDWRCNISYRNALVRAAVLFAIDNHLRDVTSLQTELWAHVKYGEMSKRDRNRFDQDTNNLRRIIEYWDLLDVADQQEFREAKVPPSTTRKLALAARDRMRLRFGAKAA